MTDKATTPTSLRLPDGLLRQLTKTAHKLEMSRTMYITTALQAAVAHDLPSAEYRQAWDTIKGMYDALEPDIMNSGAPNADMRLATALETVLPRLRGVE
jgi:predicted transcriptional regulator